MLDLLTLLVYIPLEQILTLAELCNESVFRCQRDLVTFYPCTGANTQFDPISPL